MTLMLIESLHAVSTSIDILMALKRVFPLPMMQAQIFIFFYSPLLSIRIEPFPRYKESRPSIAWCRASSEPLKTLAY